VPLPICICKLHLSFLRFAQLIAGFSSLTLVVITNSKSTVDTLACSAESDTEAFCEYGSAFLKVYAMFIGGTDGNLLTTETDTNLLVLSIFYSFLFSIILLNVLVAVIFDAWGKVSPYGRLFYWRFRHQFLVETIFARRRFGGVDLSFMDKVDRHLDGVISRFSLRPERVNDMVDGSSKAREVVLYMAEGIYLALWFVLGLLSASVLWPRAFRKAIFCTGEEEAVMTGTSLKTETTCSPTSDLDHSAHYDYDYAPQSKVRRRSSKPSTTTNVELVETRQQLAASQQEVWEVKQAIDDLKRLVVGMSAK
jgi:hypothetical protein